MWREPRDKAPNIGDDDLSETTTERIPAVILEEIGAGRGCGVVPVEVSVVTGEKTENMENKLDIGGGQDKDGGGSKTKSNVNQDFGVPSCASL